MVVKKYLCAAPRPENWEEKAQALLRSFEGNVEKRDETLRQTLQQLKAIRTYERRTGPGRKSNAEHAIAFYEYVLGEGESEDENDDNNDNEDGDDDDHDNNNNNNNEEEKEKQEKINTKNKNHNHSDEEEGQKDKVTEKTDDNDEEEKTIESMDSQEFLNQHNDECDVCNLGGDLLCCSTCSLVFHLDCVRPKLEALPEGDWSCAYCILGNGRYKKHSKAWRAASNAVRHMGRLRNAKIQESENNDDPEKAKDFGETEKESNDEDATRNESSSETRLDENEDMQSVAETEKHENTHHQEDRKTHDRKSLALSKISDALSPILPLDSTESTGRARRPRRQPILYDPQIGPDSRWKSDTLPMKASSSSDKEENASTNEQDENDRASPTKRRRSREKSEVIVVEPAKKSSDDNSNKTDCDVQDETKLNLGTASSTDDDEGKNHHWCNFCQDDPSIPICVFCACRICFGKHETEKLLLCDQCDEEYHTFCLKPPLASIPTTKKWFCPTCKAAASASGSTDSKTLTRRHTSSPTKSSTAPTPNSTRSTSSASSKKETPQTPTVSKSNSSSSLAPDAITPKRTRGRPPKTSANSSESTLSPRKRGRPTKSSPTITSPSPEEGAARKRGRPPKTPLTPITPSSPVRKKTGPKTGSTSKRPISPSTRNADNSVTSKVARTESISNSSEATTPNENPPEPIKTSRSGRVVKRSSFHDELEEGEQHLRSAKKGAEGEHDSKRGQLTAENLMEGPYSADDATMGSTEHQEQLINETIEDDEVSEDTGHGRPVRTKVIEPPNTNISQQEPVFPMEVENKEEVLTETTAAAVSSTIVPPQEAMPTEPKVPTTKEEKVTTRGLEQNLKESIERQSIEQKGVSVTIAASDLKVTETSTQPPVVTKQVTSHVPRPPLVVPTATATNASNAKSPTKLPVDVKALVKAAIAGIPKEDEDDKPTGSGGGPVKVPRRKPGARECMQISRRFGVRAIPKKYMDTLLDYCTRGKVEHLIRMRERLDEHSRFLESQLAGLEALVREKGETDVVVPPLPERAQNETPGGKPLHHATFKSYDDGSSVHTKTVDSAPVSVASLSPASQAPSNLPTQSSTDSTTKTTVAVEAQKLETTTPVVKSSTTAASENAAPKPTVIPSTVSKPVVH